MNLHLELDARHASNREAWNEAAEHYSLHADEGIEFLRSGGMNFVEPELDYLVDLNMWCNRAIHLQCAGGTDTLSLWNLGAHEVIGVDISPKMIEVAERKSKALAAPAQWVCCDVLRTPEELNGTADLVYTGRGALNWQMDLATWAAVPARLLKPGGKLFIFEGHPITWLWDMEADHYRIDPAYGRYFDEQVYADTGWPESYIPHLSKSAEEQATKYERLWRIDQMVNAVIGAGLRIVRLGEHPEPYWEQFPKMPEDELHRLPQTFALLAIKE